MLSPQENTTEEDRVHSCSSKLSHLSFNVRRYAFSALGHLPRVSVEAIRALRLAMRDVEKVQQEAMQTVLHFRQVEGDLAATLAEMLADPSAAVGYASARLLEALGRSERIGASERQTILHALARAIRDPRAKRKVWLQEDEGIRYVGQLDQLYHRALLSIAEGGRG